MFFGTVLQVLVVPTLFVIFQSIQERIKPIKWKDTDPVELAKEIEQYETK